MAERTENENKNLFFEEDRQMSVRSIRAINMWVDKPKAVLGTLPMSDVGVDSCRNRRLDSNGSCALDLETFESRSNRDDQSFGQSSTDLVDLHDGGQSAWHHDRKKLVIAINYKAQRTLTSETRSVTRTRLDQRDVCPQKQYGSTGAVQSRAKSYISWTILWDQSERRFSNLPRMNPGNRNLQYRSPFEYICRTVATEERRSPPGMSSRGYPKLLGNAPVMRTPTNKLIISSGSIRTAVKIGEKCWTSWKYLENWIWLIANHAKGARLPNMMRGTLACVKVTRGKRAWKHRVSRFASKSRTLKNLHGSHQDEIPKRKRRRSSPQIESEARWNWPSSIPLYIQIRSNSIDDRQDERRERAHWHRHS